MKPGACPVCNAPQSTGADKLGEVFACGSCKTILKAFISGGGHDVRLKFLQVVSSGSKSLPELIDTPDFRAKYRPFRKLGEGGMGVVHKAIENSTGRRVAIKSLLFDGLPELTKRFEMEGQLLAKMDHQHIVKLLEVGHEGAHHYMVFELVDGVTLKEELDRNLVLPPKRALEIVEQVLKGLDYAHGLGVVHRDIKPENVLLTKFGYVKIADFGLAKSHGLDIEPDPAPPEDNTDTPVDEPSLSSSHSTLVVSGIHDMPARPQVRKTVGGDSRRTFSGAILGTPSYMSPEQAQGRPVNHQTDLYATGIMLWELLAGRYLYKGSDIQEILQKQVHDIPPPVSKANSKVPAFLDDLVARAIAKSMMDRFQTARDFGIAVGKAIKRLEDVSLSRVAVPPPGTGPQSARMLRPPSKSGVRAAASRSSAPWLQIGLAVASVLLVALAVFVYAKRF
ncbi:MAG: protein kinase [Candidatus Wallbacteria bacterium]|nr:protein kinase [Candidatus Wallbacteria bacterium]